MAILIDVSTEFPAASQRSIAKFTGKIDKIEPWLRKTIWPPMTYMIIPSVLEGADTLIRDLTFETNRTNDDALRAQLLRVTKLRAEFKREA